MGAGSWVVDLVQALAWPLVTLGLCLTLRRELGTLLSSRLQKVKVGSVLEFTFSEVLPLLREGIRRSPIQQEGLTATDAQYLKVGASPSRGGPEESVRRVHAFLRARLAALLPDGERPTGETDIYQVALRLDELGLIASPTTSTIASVALLGNIAESGAGHVSIEDSRDFVGLVEEVIRRLPKEPS